MLFVFMYYCYLMLFHFSQYILKTSFSVHFLSLFFFSSLSLFTTVLLYLYFNYKMICFVEYIFVLFHFNLVILISLPLIWLTNTNREKFVFLFFSTLFDVIIQSNNPNGRKQLTEVTCSHLFIFYTLQKVW